MNELYLLKKQLDDLYNKIPKYERDNNIDSPELESYNEALKVFVSSGQKFFEDDSLKLEDIERKICEYSVAKTKETLSRDSQDILSAMDNMEEIERDSLMRLEYCLVCRDENPKDFYEDDNFAGDKEFLESFSDEEIASFSSLQDQIRKSPNEGEIHKL